MLFAASKDFKSEKVEKWHKEMFLRNRKPAGENYFIKSNMYTGKVKMKKNAVNMSLIYQS